MSDTRKLATILAVDIVGYSRATESDDAGAAATVRALRERLKTIAERHGGRVFSSAGDGFMVELPTASAGLEAAIALLEAPGEESMPKLRVGLHLGEVMVEADGDLLGHGVNIAARLQQLAPVGGLFVSEDVRRSVSGELAQTLSARGEVTLHKMSEKLSVYAYKGGALGPPLWLRSRRIRAGLALAGLAIIALALIPLLAPRTDSARTAVFTFDADAATRSLADETADLIAVTMNELGLPAVARSETALAEHSAIDRARRLGAAFVIDGSVLQDGQTVRASVRLEDVRTRQTIWAQSYEQAAPEAAALRPEIAAEVVKVLECAVTAQTEGLRLAPLLMAALLRTCELSAETGREGERLRFAQEIAAQMPRSSFIQGRSARIMAEVSLEMPGEIRAELRQDALATAERALRLDRSNGAAAAIKVWALMPGQARAETEAVLRPLVRDAPDNAELNGLYARFLRDVGRNQEAVVYYQRAYAREPLAPFRIGNLAWALALVGRNGDAQELLARTAQNWPNESNIAWARFRTAYWFGSPASALQILAESERTFAPADRACWERVIEAAPVASPAVRRAAAEAAESCMQPQFGIQVLGALGENDRAFALVERLRREEGADIFHGAFFAPSTAAMRSDPRFMPLMQDFGLVDYWRETDRWPDFCAEPDLPYDCRAEAGRLRAR